MKMQSKPIVALASGAFLLLGVLCQSTQAQGLIMSNTVTLADVFGNASGPTALTVQYEVFQNLDSAPYTYEYVVGNPTGDSATVGTFEVGFNAAPLGAAFNLAGGTYRINDGSSGITWGFLPGIGAGSKSGVLSFDSDNSPFFGNANAGGSPNPPSPWNSFPNGSQVAVPNPPVIPEPATTALFSLTLLGFLAVRPNVFKKA